MPTPNPNRRNSGRGKRWFISLSVLAVLIATLAVIGNFTNWYGTQSSSTPATADSGCIAQVQIEDKKLEDYLKDGDRDKCIQAVINKYGQRVAQALTQGKFDEPAHDKTPEKKAQKSDQFGNDKPKGYAGPGFVSAKDGGMCASVYWFRNDNAQDQEQLKADTDFTKLGTVNASGDRFTSVWFQAPEDDVAYWRLYRITSQDVTQVTGNGNQANPCGKQTARKVTPVSPKNATDAQRLDEEIIDQFIANIASYPVLATSPSSA